MKEAWIWFALRRRPLRRYVSAMDYGKFRYEQDKRAKEQKKSSRPIEVKEVQLSCRIDKHDFDMKVAVPSSFCKTATRCAFACVLKEGKWHIRIWDARLSPDFRTLALSFLLRTRRPLWKAGS